MFTSDCIALPLCRETSQTRETYGRPPPAPVRSSSSYLPFGSYAEQATHPRAPGRYSSSTYQPPARAVARRSVTPGPAFPSQVSTTVKLID